MNAAHLRKLQEGRRREHARRRQRQLDAMNSYSRWVKDEARAYRELLRAREMFGDGSHQAEGAYERWRMTMGAMPPMSTLPPDSTWRELRGD